jgi:hypothetical protein
VRCLPSSACTGEGEQGHPYNEDRQVTQISDVTKAAQAAPGAIRGFMALSTPARLRSELSELMDLYAQAHQLAEKEGVGRMELSEAATILAKLVEKDARDLQVAIGGPFRFFQPSWRPILVVILLAATLWGTFALLLELLGAHAWVWGFVGAVALSAVLLSWVSVTTLISVVRGPQRTIVHGRLPENTPQNQAPVPSGTDAR